MVIGDFDVLSQSQEKHAIICYRKSGVTTIFVEYIPFIWVIEYTEMLITEPLFDSSEIPGTGCLDVYVVLVVPPDTYCLPHSGHMPVWMVTVE
jgi:hypothetical protein